MDLYSDSSENKHSYDCPIETTSNDCCQHATHLKASAYGYPSRMHHSQHNYLAQAVTGNHILLLDSPTISAFAYTHSISQVQPDLSSPNRDPCLAISQQTMHNASSFCIRVRTACLSSFFSDLYSNVVIMVQDCFLS